jgi:hypothetical protein
VTLYGAVEIIVSGFAPLYPTYKTEKISKGYRGSESQPAKDVLDHHIRLTRGLTRGCGARRSAAHTTRWLDHCAVFLKTLPAAKLFSWYQIKWQILPLFHNHNLASFSFKENITASNETKI